MISKGSEYFSKSRQLQDIANCRDLVSLQAIVFMNLFLLTTNRSSTCYTYLCTSLSIAVRMGLHRSLKTDQDLISQEISKRLFWALWLLVNDVSSCCGMPRLLSDSDIDQEFPREANDVYITSRNISMQPQSEICYISGANASYRLHMIRDKVTRQMYPVKPLGHDQLHDSTAHAANLEKVRETEDDLKKWANSIPRGAIVTLFYIIIASRGSYQPDFLFKSLAIGMKLLDQLAKQSYPASRFKVILVTMVSTLPEDLQKVRDRLLNFDSEAPNVLSNERPEHNRNLSNDSYTASLAGIVFSARPDSRLRRPSLLPLTAGFMKQSDGGFHKSDLAGENDQNLQSGQTLSSPMNETTEWATIEPKIQTTEFNDPESQSHQSHHQTPDLPAQPATEGSRSSHIPNVTAPESADQHWQAQPFSLRQDGYVSVDNGFDISNTEHSEINEEPLAGMFNTGGLDLGDIDDFFDFGSWF
ncbi:Transcription factor, fungi [Penicillium expansum]|uniref:Transcription factor, fungi n=1 Tax=Penicillium expansum TaxID=27334 RepID=A0A0A2ID84_PENEN|nr:Transcription factor, fungi [Penicillium expansum]KGO40376.1 Transcription factor, fungi [Penicillium expansum]KGO54959.1 Transcription factor, fungi [Penicillium expansum]